MPEPPTVRAAEASELEAVADLLDLAFHDTHDPGPRERATARLDRERSRMAFVGDELVGTSGSWGWRLTVPGGELDCSAITIVTVLPTHRRQGILRAMMEAQIALARERGEPLAALWASEATIYGRFGFGPATWQRSLRVDLRREVPLRAPATVAPLRLLRSLDGAEPLLRPIFERARTRRAGTMSRTPSWWTRITFDEERERSRYGAKRAIVAGDEGYAIYRALDAGAEANAKVTVEELIATTPEAERTLLDFLLRIDLVAELRLEGRPVDDPLALAPVDVRAIETGDVGDALWLRLLDLPAAVAGRSWAAAAELVLEVEHPEDALVAGRWSLRVGPDGGACERTDRPADLRLHARELGSVYLGGVPLATLRDAGLVEERTPGAVAALDAALRVERAPWVVDGF
jgi:predicted acetyltransferase